MSLDINPHNTIPKSQLRSELMTNEYAWKVLARLDLSQLEITEEERNAIQTARENLHEKIKNINIEKLIEMSIESYVQGFDDAVSVLKASKESMTKDKLMKMFKLKWGVKNV